MPEFTVIYGSDPDYEKKMRRYAILRGLRKQLAAPPAKPRPEVEEVPANAPFNIYPNKACDLCGRRVVAYAGRFWRSDWDRQPHVRHKVCPPPPPVGVPTSASYSYKIEEVCVVCGELVNGLNHDWTWELKPLHWLSVHAACVDKLTPELCMGLGVRPSTPMRAQRRGSKLPARRMCSICQEPIRYHHAWLWQLALNDKWARIHADCYRASREAGCLTAAAIDDEVIA